MSSEKSAESLPDHSTVQAPVPEPAPAPAPTVAATPPDGGLQAWLQVLGAFFLFFSSWYAPLQHCHSFTSPVSLLSRLCSLISNGLHYADTLCSNRGLVVAFGAYEDFLKTNYLSHKSASDISWIGTIQGFLLIVVGVITGPIYDMGYLRGLILAGIVLSFVGLMTASVATSYYSIFLSLGVCVGLGSGCLFVPSVAIVAQYFTTKRAAATGITATGGSIGKPPPSYISHPRDPRLPPRCRAPRIYTDSRVAGGVIFPIAFRKLTSTIGYAWANRILAFIVLGTLIVPLVVLKPRVQPSKRRTLLDPKAFAEMPYLFFSLALFFIFVGLYIPFFYISIYAREKIGTNEDLSFYLLAILNAASVFGRLVPNILADKLGSLQVLLPCTLICALLALCWIAVHNLAGTVVFCIFYGFFSGAIVSLPPTALVVLSPDLSVVGTRMGMSFSFAGFGLLIGSPAGGSLLKSAAGFAAVQGFAGATIGVGFIFFVLAVLAHQKPTATGKI